MGKPATPQAVIIRHLGLVDFRPTWEAMQTFNQGRGPDTTDEIWLLQHPPIYTLGLNAKHTPPPTGHGHASIPVINIDRGGDITYHGPGQWVAYVMMDLQRRGWGARQLVAGMEQAVIELLAAQGIGAQRQAGAPGIYVDNKKIASLGLRVRRGGSYHGIAVNINMDLTPFTAIAPCGYQGLKMTQLADLVAHVDMPASGEALLAHLQAELGYTLVTQPQRHSAG